MTDATVIEAAAAVVTLLILVLGGIARIALGQGAMQRDVTELKDVQRSQGNSLAEVRTDVAVLKAQREYDRDDTGRHNAVGPRAPRPV